MNKLVLILLSIVILSLPTIVSAHTELKVSSPKEGQVLKDDLSEVRLQFEGDIEKLSTMKLIKDGEEIPFDQIQTIEQEMVGSLSEPLQNGSYVIQWNIAGEDGHPIEGIIPFAVQIEQKNEKENPSTSNQEQEQVNKQNEKPTNQLDNNTHNESNLFSPNLIEIGITVVLVLILIVGIRLLFRKKS